MEKAYSAFPSEARLVRGVRKTCRACRTAYRLANRRANPDRDREAQRRFCNKANRAEQLRAKVAERRQKAYGLTQEQYDAMVEAQGNACAICGSTEFADRFHKTLSVDHDHATGRVRALLCNRCNRAIGLLNDDPVILRMAAAYLERHK